MKQSGILVLIDGEPYVAFCCLLKYKANYKHTPCNHLFRV